MNSISYLEINEGLGLLKLANTVLILINPSPSNVKVNPLADRLGISENKIFILYGLYLSLNPFLVDVSSV